MYSALLAAVVNSIILFASHTFGSNGTDQNTIKSLSFVKSSYILYAWTPIVYSTFILWGAKGNGLKVNAVKVISFLALSLLINILYYFGVIFSGLVLGKAAFIVSIPLGLMYFICMILFVALFTKLFEVPVIWLRTFFEILAYGALASLFILFILYAGKMATEYLLIIFIASWQLLTGWQLQKWVLQKFKNA
jgi:hypothetical protein